MVRDIYPGPNDSQPQHLLNVNGVLYFYATDDLYQTELWKSDGTAEGTVPFTTFQKNQFISNYPALLKVGGTLFFGAYDSAGFELWKTDGTVAGTTLVKDIRPGVYSSGMRHFTEANGVLYFIANDGVHGEEMWRSDGTSAGTYMLKEISPTGWPGVTGRIANINGTIYFTGNDGVHGQELWKSDGTAEGTVMVKDIAPGATNSTANGFVAIGDVIYFLAKDSHGGFPKLWRTDGSAAGTTVVTPNPNGFISSLTEFNGELHLSARLDARGDELWKIDGLAGTLQRVSDLNTGPGDSYPEGLVNVNGRLFFSANDVVHGRELWVLDPASPSGDFNGDRRVDGSDFLAWQRQFGFHRLWKFCRRQWRRRRRWPRPASLARQFWGDWRRTPVGRYILSACCPVSGAGVRCAYRHRTLGRHRKAGVVAVSRHRAIALSAASHRRSVIQCAAIGDQSVAHGRCFGTCNRPCWDSIVAIAYGAGVRGFLKRPETT